MSRRASVGALGTIALGLAALALQRSGHGSLAPPPLGEPGRWGSWLAARDPVAAAFSLVRLGALGALWYLAAAAVVGLALRLAGATRLVVAADRLTVSPVRRMLAGITLSVAATSVVAGTVGPATMVPVAVAGQAAPPATITMHRLGPEPLPSPAPAVAPPADTPSPPTPAPGVTGRWTVRSGECFWTIAESVLAQAWGRPPTDAEIVPYWDRLIWANQASLVHPGIPDLIYPGQVFEVPAP